MILAVAGLGQVLLAPISLVLVSGGADSVVLVPSLGRIFVFVLAILGAVSPWFLRRGSRAYGAAEVARGRCFVVPGGALLRER